MNPINSKTLSQIKTTASNVQLFELAADSEPITEAVSLA
jgi:hypothetical protein